MGLGVEDGLEDPWEEFGSRLVVRLDPDGAIDREPADPAPDPPSACARYVGHSGGVQEPPSRERPQDAGASAGSQALALAQTIKGLQTPIPGLRNKRDCPSPWAYRFLVCGLPYGPGFLREAEGDLRNTGEFKPEAVTWWWRLVLIAYAGNPTLEVARWILTGQG